MHDTPQAWASEMDVQWAGLQDAWDKLIYLVREKLKIQQENTRKSMI